MVKLINGCDGAHHTINIHFTKACPHSCAWCVDKDNRIPMEAKDGPVDPNVKKIVNKVIELDNMRMIGVSAYEDVLFLGGEPLMYIKELIDCIKRIQLNCPALRIYVTTSLPKIIMNKRKSLDELLSLVDGLNISLQHPNDMIASMMLHADEDDYDIKAIELNTDADIDNFIWRSELMRYLSNSQYKEKIRINLNLVKPWLCTKEHIMECIDIIDQMGFGSIKLSELVGYPDGYVSFEKVFKVKLPSPYSHGCVSDISNIIGCKTPIYLKRACFLVEPSLKASFSDGIKAIYKRIKKPYNDFIVVNEGGFTQRSWKECGRI